MDYLNNYKNITDNNDALITFFCYNQKISVLIKLFEEQLSNAKKISNPIKKNKICNRFYIFMYVNEFLNIYRIYGREGRAESQSVIRPRESDFETPLCTFFFFVGLTSWALPCCFFVFVFYFA